MLYSIIYYVTPHSTAIIYQIHLSRNEVLWNFRIWSQRLNNTTYNKTSWKCNYSESHIFSIKAILKHKQVPCMKRKILFTIFKYLFLFQRFSSLKYANWSSDDVINSTKFWSIMVKKDISANLYHKCFFFSFFALRFY